jgi:ABC-2 type transport system permease protein
MSGASMLFRKEIRRFLKVPGQTVFAPVGTTVLYLLVFGYALGGRVREVGGLPYFDFIVPGLITLGITSNSFMNTSSSFMGMKLMGTIVDLLVTPLTPFQIVLAMVGASAARGLLVGLLTWATAVAFRGEIHVAYPLLALAFPLLTAIGFSALGLLTGLWAEGFERLSFVPSFILTPLTFLGGVFYDVRMLPPTLAALSHANPILYLVEGMRYGLHGTAGVHPAVGLLALAGFDAIVVGACMLALGSGWKLRN